MNLNDAQRRMLDGEDGEIVQRLMRLLVRLGQIYEADQMLEITSAQISGVSYKSLGDPGLLFLEDIANAGVQIHPKVLAYANPAGMDLEDWEKMGVPRDFATKQIRIINAFRSMGVIPSTTCTPYLAGNLPCFGQHIAWAESSAVSFANSVIGARTNREGGPSALAAAICGCTPNHGLHLDANRTPTMLVQVDFSPRSRADFGALGYAVGERVKDGIPYFRGIQTAGLDDFKALGAAMAASGAIALYHVEGLTPEAHLCHPNGLDSFCVDSEALVRVYEKLNTTTEPERIVLGCPHASLGEIQEIAHKLEGKRLGKPLIICTSRTVKQIATEAGLTEIIRRAGGSVVADTCMVVAPIEKMGFNATAVNSGKAANYLPGFCNQQVVFRNVDDLIAGALESEETHT